MPVRDWAKVPTSRHVRFIDLGMDDSGIARYVERRIDGDKVVDYGPVLIARYKGNASWDLTMELAEEEEAVKIIQMDKFGQLVDVFRRCEDDSKMCDMVSGVLTSIEADDGGAPVLVLHQDYPEKKVIPIPVAEIVRVARA